MNEPELKMCRYKYCKHESREIPIGEEILDGKLNYHKDCYEEMEAKTKIVDVWKERIDPYPLITSLRSTIKDILENQDISAKQLLFQLKWCLNHGWKIRYPGGLRYVAKCEEAKEAYKSAIMPKFADSLFVANEEYEAAPKTFNYKPQKSGFSKIIRSPNNKGKNQFISPKNEDA